MNDNVRTGDGLVRTLYRCWGCCAHTVIPHTMIGMSRGKILVRTMTPSSVICNM